MHGGLELNTKRPILEGVGPTKNQNRSGLVESYVCFIVALQRTISGEKS